MRKKETEQDFFKIYSRWDNENITGGAGSLKSKQQEKFKKEYNEVGIQSFFLNVIMIEL